MDKKRSTSSKSHEDVEGEPVAKKSRLVFKTIIYDESIPNQWLDEPPLAVWDHMIIPFLGLKDLALSRPVCTFFEAYWQEKFSNNVLPLRVGYDVATINEVMDVIEELSSRREYTKASPFVVLLGKGQHQVTMIMDGLYRGETVLEITRSNILFLGKGIDATKMLGEFEIFEQQNITFKQLTLTNTNAGHGIYISNSEVEIVDVVITRCEENGITVYSDQNLEEKEQVVLTRCQITDNSTGVNAGDFANIKMIDCIVRNNTDTGMFISRKCTINVHGEATAIHSNGDTGIYASVSSNVRIHLPSHHNTIYNNGEDRMTSSGGTITNVE